MLARMSFHYCVDVFEPPSLVSISARVLASNIHSCLMWAKPDQRFHKLSKSRGSFKSRLLRFSRRKSSKESTSDEIRVSNCLPSSILEIIWQESLQLQQGIAVEDVYFFLNESCRELDLRHCVAPSLTMSKKKYDRRKRITKLLEEIPQYSPNLKHLNLSHQEFLPNCFDFLVQLSQLESLKFDYCDFDDNRLESLANSLSTLRNIKIISLQGSRGVGDEALIYLCRTVKQLEALDLREIQNLGDWNFLAEAQHLRLIEHTHLISRMSTYFRNNYYDYTGTLPVYRNEYIQYSEWYRPHLLVRHLHTVFPHLIQLELNTPMGPEILEMVRQLPSSLKELALSSSKMSAEGTSLLNAVQSCGNGLTVLFLSGFSSLPSLETLARLCPNLETLRLKHCRLRSDDDSNTALFPRRQASYQQQPCWIKLEHLEVSNVPVPDDDWLLLLSLKSLKRVVLCFVNNVSIDDKILDQLSCAKMRYLALVGAGHVTSKGVENLISRLSQQRGGPMPIKLVVSDCGDDIAQHRTELVKLARAKTVRLFLH